MVETILSTTDTLIHFWGYLSILSLLILLLLIVSPPSPKSNENIKSELFVEIEYQDCFDVSVKKLKVKPDRFFLSRAGWCISVIDLTDNREKTLLLKYIKNIDWRRFDYN